MKNLTQGSVTSVVELSRKTKTLALAHGADLVGIVRVSDLPEHTPNIIRILPSAQSVVVVAAKHSLAAIRSDNNEAAQFDTIYTYNSAEQAAQITARFLESEGFPSVAVPAFIPLDMSETKKGMRGEICWRRTGVRAGLGSYGENGLLVTAQYGAAVRLAGLVTAAVLAPDHPLDQDECDHCGQCVEACPSGALSGGGKINKKLCGDEIFKYGFRSFKRLLENLVRLPASEAEKVLQGEDLRQIWQNFMTGNYYYCFKCQSQCFRK